MSKIHKKFLWGQSPHNNALKFFDFHWNFKFLEIFEYCSALVGETNWNTGFVHRLHVKRVGSHIENINENSNNTVSHEYCCDFEISVHEEFHYCPNVTLTVPNISQTLYILNVCTFDNFSLLHFSFAKLDNFHNFYFWNTKLGKLCQWCSVNVG